MEIFYKIIRSITAKYMKHPDLKVVQKNIDRAIYIILGSM